MVSEIEIPQAVLLLPAGITSSYNRNRNKTVETLEKEIH